MRKFDFVIQCLTVVLCFLIVGSVVVVACYLCSARGPSDLGSGSYMTWDWEKGWQSWVTLKDGSVCLTETARYYSIGGTGTVTFGSEPVTTTKTEGDVTTTTVVEAKP